uniref:Uncharacterized protein n=1 Tax=Oryza meridionalis TaxID=40149 RepID=A0A0E0EE70_9ORYZ
MGRHERHSTELWLTRLSDMHICRQRDKRKMNTEGSKLLLGFRVLVSAAAAAATFSRLLRRFGFG